ncbi:MAG: FMN-binding protein [Clostridiales bacterium]|nr:FMN-binding protein [Clostridiales bacterium]
MENKTSAFKEYFSPILVLVIICFVTTLLLAFTYGVTNPIIQKNAAERASEARKELLAEADDFTVSDFDDVADNDSSIFDYEAGKVYVQDCYVANNGTGAVMTVVTNSYGGALTMMVGINADGEITGVKVMSHADTPGVGTKAHEGKHLDQYIGLSELGSDQIKSDPTVNHVTGASISSTAVHKGVYCALELFKAMGGVK